MDTVCEILSTAMNEVFWRAWVLAIVELLPIVAFLILFYKAFRKDSMSFWLKDFRLEIALLFPWAITQAVRSMWVLFCLIV